MREGGERRGNMMWRGGGMRREGGGERRVCVRGEGGG